MEGFTVSRLFRGTRYDITVKRGDEKGLVADGVRVVGNTVPLTEKKTCSVELTI